MKSSEKLNLYAFKRLFVILLVAVIVVCGAGLIACNIFVKLDSISAVYNGDGIEVGGALEKSKITVTAKYSDNSDKTVTNFELSGFSSETAGDKVVTISYTENNVTKTTTVTVKVVETNPEPVTLVSITAVYNGPEIEIGGTLNKADIEVTAYYSDTTDKAVTDFEVSGFDSSTFGVKRVNVTYTDGIKVGCVVEITVKEKTPEVANYGKYGILQQDGSVKITNTSYVQDELQIHFIAFENNLAGDSVFIKAGDTDILIDAGSTYSSAATIDKYISNYCTDGVLEYVIATHAHEDHISGFVGNSTVSGILDRYKCENIIRYANRNTTSQVSKDFEAKCDVQKQNGANVITALEWWNNESGRKIKLTDYIEMEIVYNKYYASPIKSDENSNSVCVMFNQYGQNYDNTNAENPDNDKYVNHYLFTGDLESNGERAMVQYYNSIEKPLPHCVLYKGGHHGSDTSSSQELMAAITPKLVCICTCCGDKKYNFPAQEAIDRIAVQTDMVFLTNVNVEGSSSTPLNGNICVTSNEKGVFVNCTNNNTLFKDTEWFNQNRICPEAWKKQEETTGQQTA